MIGAQGAQRVGMSFAEPLRHGRIPGPATALHLGTPVACVGERLFDAEFEGNG